MRGHSIQHRISHHRFSAGHRPGPVHRRSQPGALPADYRLHPDGGAGYSEGSRHGRQLLAHSGRSPGCVCHRAGHSGRLHRAARHGQDYGPQPRHHPPVAFGMGVADGHAGHDYRPAADHPDAVLLPTVHHQQRTDQAGRNDLGHPDVCRSF